MRRFFLFDLRDLPASRNLTIDIRNLNLVLRKANYHICNSPNPYHITQALNRPNIIIGSSI